MYEVKPRPELLLRRTTLHRWLALRSAHGDFAWYYRKFGYKDAKVVYACGRLKTPEHLAIYYKSRRTFGR